MSGQSEMLSKAEDIADKVSQPTQQLNSPGLAVTYGFQNKCSSLFDWIEVPTDLSFSILGTLFLFFFDHKDDKKNSRNLSPYTIRHSKFTLPVHR